MRSLKLRRRLAIAGALIVAVQLVVSLIVIGATRGQLIDQLDDRLVFVASTGSDSDTPATGNDSPGGSDDLDGPGDSDGPDERRSSPRPERPADIYQGLLDTSGVLTSSFLAAKQGVELAPPTVDLDNALAADGAPLTALSADGALRYRIVASPVPSEGFVVTGLALDGVDETVTRLRGLLIGLTLAVIGALAVAGWWTVRYGIAPIESMTNRAATVSSEDLSIRIEDIDDGTEAGLLGESINTMLDRLQASFDQRRLAEERLRRFLADASHELRTPVATIRGYAELYRNGGLEDKGELDDALRRTEQESQRMTRLITDMLNLARLDQEPTMDTEVRDLTVPVSDTISDAQASHPDRTVRASMCAGPVFVNANDDMLRQVFTNIVSNAIRHTNPETIVAVSLRIDQEIAIFEVTDDGPGMAPEVLAKATERFYRADPSRSRQRGGSGLGLAIADSVVAALGGTLKLESTLGEGTTVIVGLPLANA